MTLRVLHMDGGRAWAGGQNQVRLLMRGLAHEEVEQLCIAPEHSPLVRRLSEEGLPVRAVRWRGGLDPGAMWSVLREARGFDVIHTHDAHALQIAMAPALLRRVPIVASRRVPFRTNAWKWNRAARVIAISRLVENALRSAGVDSARIRRIASGVDPREGRALPGLEPSLRARAGAPPDQWLVGNVAHLHGWKGHSDLVQLAARLPHIRCVILGEGAEREALERRARDAGVADRVRLLGAIPEARAAIREMDLFLFPSRADALGTSVLDAMASRVPVLAADAAGGAEILEPVHARTGCSLYPPGDIDALASCVEKIRGDAALRSAMLEAQDQRLRDFDIRNTVRQTLSLYREVLA